MHTLYIHTMYTAVYSGDCYSVLSGHINNTAMHFSNSKKSSNFKKGNIWGWPTCIKNTENKRGMAKAYKLGDAVTLLHAADIMPAHI